MTVTWKQLALGLAIMCAAVLTSAQSFAQDAKAKFGELAPKMTAENMADEGQVKAMEAAQQEWMTYALQKVDERKAILDVMLEALKGDYPTPTKSWLLHLLGWTGDDSCVETIATFLTSDQPSLFDESARALGQIGSEKSIGALKAAQAKSKNPESFASYIKAPNVDIAVGVETELPLALPYVDQKAYDEYMAKFDSLNDDEKARALGDLRVRKDKKYLDLAVKAAGSENGDVKKAALLALEKIATGKEFGVLYDAMKSFDRGLVVRIMKNVPGTDFDAAVVAALKAEKDGGNLASLAEVVGGRYLNGEIATLLDVAKKDDCPARLQLIAAAEGIATKDNVGDFVDVFLALAPNQRGERDRAEQIISRLCAEDAQPVIAKLNNDNAAQIFPLLGRVGGDAALKLVKSALDSKDPNAITLGVRALCNWPNAVVANDLLAVVKNASYPDQLKVPALRAYIRVVSLPDDQDGVDMSGKDKLNALKEAMKLATRNDERNLVLERVGSVRELDSVKFALAYVDDVKLQNKALNAILDLAHQDYLRKMDKELFTKALDVVLEKGDQGQKDRAGNYKANIR